MNVPIPVKDGQVQEVAEFPVNAEQLMSKDEGRTRWFLQGKDVSFKPALDYPPHQRCVEVDIDLGMASPADAADAESTSAVVIGGDLTYEYVAINAEYRS